jgi:hypothetical protein
VRQRLLILGAETPALQRVVPILRRAEFDPYQAPNVGEALDLLQDIRFDLIVVRVPLAGVTLAELVERVRGPGCACRNAGLLVLADATSAGELASFIGRGVNRVVDLDAPSDRLLGAIADLLGVDPRRTLRAVIQLELWVDRGVERTLTLTENVSPTGLLVRGCGELPIGSRLRFELLLHGAGEPVRGEVEVVRHTDAVREGVEGFGGAIIAFEGDGEGRLARFLRDR